MIGLAVPAFGADEAKQKVVSVAVKDGDTFEVKIPEGWDQTQNHSPLAPTITIRPKSQEAELKITFISDPNGELSKKDHLDKAVTAAAQQYVNGSVEKENKLQSLESKNGKCKYAEFTDASLVGKQPPPGKFKVVGTGVMLLGKTAAAFTLLGNSFDDKSLFGRQRNFARRHCR